ncbi:bifunctional aspartate kinase/homoserine dehydrogenase I [Sediminibacterium soli]|uniref:bifunctional aspartate kinase/homoserine dehydrogenase I n=1 Tax=Sediminibacterium soli TaxID=2698829 RepID=UPI00137B2DA3|nr:bifunctional aspartate kinase/homoserine dehydrogenase I [Sediminibacterium soli]NCI45204.1 bifunctional aspartate kinase/homoserine dehydrogenase I [Sediminibacterium soli]
MQVVKFGGSSVANAANIQKVVSIVKELVDKEPVILVVSALSGVTDLLLKTGELASHADESYKPSLKEMELRHLDTVRELLPIQHQSATLSLVKQQFNELDNICDGVFLLGELSARTKDRIVSYGELLSSLIISATFQSLQTNQHWLDSRKLIVTNERYGNASVDHQATEKRISEYLSQHRHRLYIAPGFIASDAHGNTTTLGRGGSDYTGAIYAAAVQASALEIWTDVSGMMTADPRLVQNARPIAQISYQEAMELSHFGAKIIYPPTIQPVMNRNIPVWVKNTFEPAAYGTLIENKTTASDGIIRGISSINAVSLLSLEGSGMIGIPGFSKRLFEALANENVNVILITQSSSEHSICVAINEADTYKAKQAVDGAFDYEIKNAQLDPLKVELGLSILALVGEQMKSHPGISGKMFGALGRNGINVRAIAQGSSEKNISAVISFPDVRKAINVLHEVFFETTYKQLNVFIAGAGNVGGKLLAQIAKQASFLQNELRLQLRVIGIANSRRILCEEEGIDLANWKEQLKTSGEGNIHDFVQQIIRKNLRNSVFVDVTANAEVASVYGKLLEKSVSVVACNKIACSSSYASYKQLKSLAREYNASFFFETNVGAGLPVIGTLNDLLRSGDKVNRIQAVLSGTLNFVFNHYDGKRPFAEVVRQAQDEGYTEPDPRLDLGGTDVMRKIMILAREAGQQLEMEDIHNEYFLPQSCFAGSVEDFYAEMGRQEKHFRALYDSAAAENCKLKFVASYENGHASVGLKHIPGDSDFYHLYGKDNLVLFYTDRYPEQPLVIKGAGAGADVTASGVFADIIRVAG